MEKKNKVKGIGLWTTLILYALIPLTLAIAVFTVYSIKSQKKALRNSTYERLKACSIQVGEFFKEDIDNGSLEKNEKTEQYIDSLKENDIELTLFEKDNRFMTSVRKDDGSRNNDTKADQKIWESVKNGNNYMADGVVINGEKYFVYYVPIKDISGEVWGMGFAGEKESIISKNISNVVKQSIMIAVLLFVVIIAAALLFARLIVKPIIDITNTLGDVAEGDISTPFDTRTNIVQLINIKNSIINVKQNLNEMVGKIKEAVAGLNDGVNTVSGAVEVCNNVKDGITQAVEDMAHGSSEMADSVQNTATVMNEMGRAIDNINDLIDLANDGAKDISKISNVAKADLLGLIDANKETVNATDDVVRGINEAANEVEEIRRAAEDITGIASQTNLLSLNASIEAARAGEAGRGFAVVASEIQALSEQSNKSAQKIQQILDEISRSSDRNTELAQIIKNSVSNEGRALVDLNKSFNDVSDRINAMSEQMGEIVESTDKLAANKNTIVDEISTLSSISEENAAATEETSASTQELGANIENIHSQTADMVNVSKNVGELVEFFK